VVIGLRLCSVAVVTVAGFCGPCGIKGAMSSEICDLERQCLSLEGSVFIMGMRVHLGNLLGRNVVVSGGPQQLTLSTSEMSRGSGDQEV